jgi:hypothetical protein
MADDEEYIDLPEEDEQAFVQLERKFRIEMNEELKEAEERQINNNTAYYPTLIALSQQQKPCTSEYFRISKSQTTALICGTPI